MYVSCFDGNSDIYFFTLAATKAKVIEKFDEGGEEDDYTSFTGLKKRSTRILEETDRRYAGKATSRKELQKLLAGSGKQASIFLYHF